jgi:putative DNA primase/helicase
MTATTSSSQPHDPADMITKLSPVDYDPEATAPEFESSSRACSQSSEMRLFLQQWFGLSLTG